MSKYKLNIWLRLGLGNIITVVIYRVAKRFKYYFYHLPVGKPINGSFLSHNIADKTSDTTLSYFSYHNIQVTSPPDWFVNPWNGVRCADTDQHWAA